jgi:hypothetical protein
MSAPRRLTIAVSSARAILASGTGYIVSFSAAADTMDEYRPLIDQMARSFTTD